MVWFFLINNTVVHCIGVQLYHTLRGRLYNMANFFKNIQSLKNCEEMHIYKTNTKHQDSNVNILAFACTLNGREYEGTLTKSVTEKLLNEKDGKNFNAKAFFIDEGQLGEAEKIDDETGEVSTCFCIFSKASREELLSF